MKIVNILNGVEKVLGGINLEDGKVRVELNENQLDIHITFEYNQLLGKITIKYVDQDGNEIAEPTIMDNLPLGIYEVQPKHIEGYELKIDEPKEEADLAVPENNIIRAEDIEVITPNNN